MKNGPVDSGSRTSRRPNQLDRVSVPAFTLEIGGQSETVNVRAEATLIQSQSGERSFAIETEAVQNLPISSRNFTSLAVMAPGVTVTTNVGGTTISTLGGGGGNILMDGVGISDSFSNALTFVPNVEAIGEVKIRAPGAITLGTAFAQYREYSKVQNRSHRSYVEPVLSMCPTLDSARSLLRQSQSVTACVQGSARPARGGHARHVASRLSLPHSSASPASVYPARLPTSNLVSEAAVD
ncbi:MAG: hypothetical protein ABI818_19850 [Acidobacteriota bacterium]